MLHDIKSLFKNILEFRYLLIGVLNTAFSFIFFPVVYFFLRDKINSYEVILALAYFCTSLFSFFTQKFIVFQSRGNYYNQLLKYLLFQLLIYISNLFFLYLVLPFNITDIFFLQILFALIIFTIGFFWNKFVTFKISK